MVPYTIHIANLLLLASYLVKDILWLRILAVAACVALLVDHYLTPQPWAAVYWNLLFTAINAYRIWVLIKERRPVRLSDEEQQVYQQAFRTLTPHEYKKLLRLALWEDTEQGTRIVQRDQPLARVMVIVTGRTAVEVGGKSVAELGEGKFVGEMSFLTGLNPNADVVTLAPTRLVSWSKVELKAFLEHNHELRAAMQMVIGTDLVGKLRAA